MISPFTPDSTANNALPRLLGRALLLFLAYVVTGRLGLMMPYTGSHITLIWLPTGIAVAALLRWGWRYWPAVYLGAFTVNSLIGSTWLLAGGIALGNTLGPLLAVWFLHRNGFHPAFERRRDILLFAVAAALGMLVSAANGVVNLGLAGVLPWHAIASAWLIWWGGDTVGVLLAGPLLLALSWQALREIGERRGEFAAWGVVALACAWLTVAANPAVGGRALPLAFITLPLIAWAAIRFNLLAVSIGMLGFAIITAWGSATGHGTFSLPDMHAGLLLLWVYIAITLLMGILITAQEVERKRAKEQLRQLNATLEQRIIEEVAKNREKDHLLIQQSRMAAMGEMIGNIAHQWRQPITALTLVLANIKDAYEFNELDKTYLDKSVDTGQQLIQKMSATIDDFRNFFRPNKEKAVFRLAQCFAGMEEILGLSLENHGIALERDIRQDVAVNGYANEYTQVLLNLVNNAKEAIQANRIDGGKIHVQIDTENSMATVRVRDNGGGIPENILAKIFDPYFTTKEQGTGIGLYMAKAIIEANMGGRIEARNVEGGMEFTVSMPSA